MLKDFFYNNFILPTKAKDFKKKMITMMIGIFFMGFFLSLLISINLGTDPYSSMNLGFSQILPLSFGTCQFLLNFIIFILVIFKGRNYISYGTIANMVFIGYIADFFRWIWNMIIPDSIYLDGYFLQFSFQIGLLIPVLIGFVIAAALYMGSDLGLSPYDALPFIITKRFQKLPFRLVRMSMDFLAVIIGLLAGVKFGIMTVLLALLLGPTIAFVKKILDKFWAK